MNEEIKKGHPAITPRKSTNGQYAKGKEAAAKILSAGPGQYLEATFEAVHTAEVASYTAGARNAGNKKLTVSRRKDGDTIRVYVMHTA